MSATRHDWRRHTLDGADCPLGDRLRQEGRASEPIRRGSAFWSSSPRGRALSPKLQDKLGLAQGRISSHLACLRWCGCVVALAEGRFNRYQLIDSRVRGDPARGRIDRARQRQAADLVPHLSDRRRERCPVKAPQAAPTQTRGDSIGMLAAGAVGIVCCLALPLKRRSVPGRARTKRAPAPERD